MVFIRDMRSFDKSATDHVRIKHLRRTCGLTIQRRVDNNISVLGMVLLGSQSRNVNISDRDGLEEAIVSKRTETCQKLRC
jgi:hypothetical protein